MKLRQLSDNDGVTLTVLDAFEENAPVFNDIEAYRVGGNADSLEKEHEGTSKESIFRSINEKDNRERPTFTDVPITKKIISGDSGVDRVYEQRNVNIVSKLESNTKRDAAKDAKVFQEKVFLGDSGNDSEEIDGIFAQVPAGRDENLAEAIILPLGGDSVKQQQQNFFEKFIMMQANMPYPVFHCYMPEVFTLRLVSAAKNLGYYKSIDTPLGKADAIGKAMIKSYGYKADGSQILAPADQGISGSNKTTSFTFVKWGEERDFTFATSAGLVGEYLGLVEKIYTNTWDLDGNFGLQNSKALYKINGFGLELPA